MENKASNTPDVVRTAERIRVLDVNGVPIVSYAGLVLVNGRLVNIMEDWRPCPKD